MQRNCRTTDYGMHTYIHTYIHNVHIWPRVGTHRTTRCKLKTTYETWRRYYIRLISVMPHLLKAVSFYTEVQVSFLAITLVFLLKTNMYKPYFFTPSRPKHQKVQVRLQSVLPSRLLEPNLCYLAGEDSLTHKPDTYNVGLSSWLRHNTLLERVPLILFRGIPT
jgi:hypothetical protein